MNLARVTPSFTTENTISLINEARTNPEMNSSQKYGSTKTGIQNKGI